MRIPGNSRNTPHTLIVTYMVLENLSMGQLALHLANIVPVFQILSVTIIA